MDQKLNFSGSIAYEDSYLDFLFGHSKASTFHAILYDTAGAVPSRSVKGPAYCYIIERVSKTSMLRYMTGLHFCFHLNLFRPSLFTSTTSENICLLLY